MGLLEHHVLDQVLGHDILLLYLAVLLLLTHDDSLGLGLEQHAAGGDGLRVAVLGLCHADAGESHLEDTQTLDAHLLTQFEVLFIL